MPLLWNSVNKNVSGKNLSNLNKNWIGVGRRGNNWIEPMREWLKDANHAGKLALSKDFMEIKSFAEKIGTNRRLLDKQVGWEWKTEWLILAEKQEKISLARERSERANSANKSESIIMSGRRELNPDYTHPKRA